MSPLAFELDEMYRYRKFLLLKKISTSFIIGRFISLRLENPEPDIQRQVLTWLQTLCHLGVIIPLEILYNIYTSALQCLDPGLEMNRQEDLALTLEQETNVVKSVQIVTCMLDVLIVQLKIQVS